MEALFPEFWLTGLGSWAASYLFHSTIILGVVLCFTYLGNVFSESSKDVLLKMALVAGVFTASVQFIQSSHQPFAGTLVFDLTPQNDTTRLHNYQYQRTISNDNLHYIARGGIGEPIDGQVRLAVNWLPILIGLWLLGIAIFVLRFAWRWYRFKKAIGQCLALSHQPTIKLCLQLQQQMGITRTIELTHSSHIQSPMAIGLSQICLPSDLWQAVDEQQMTAILAHELAHIGRLDPIWLFFWHLMSAVFFFQPLNRLTQLSFQSRAEFLADATAVRQTKDPVAMVNSLLKAAQMNKQPTLGALTSQLLGHNATIVARSKLLLSEKLIKPKASTTFVMLAAIALVTMAVWFLPTIALASKQVSSLSQWQQFTEQDSHVWTLFADTRLRFETNLDHVESIAGRQIELFTRRVRFSHDLDAISSFGPFARLRFVSKSIYGSTSLEISVDWRNKPLYRYQVDGKLIDDQIAALDFMRQMLDTAIGKDDEFKRKVLQLYTDVQSDGGNHHEVIMKQLQQALADDSGLFSSQDKHLMTQMAQHEALFDANLAVEPTFAMRFFNAMAIGDKVTASFSELGLLHISYKNTRQGQVNIQYDLRNQVFLDLFLKAFNQHYQAGKTEQQMVAFLVRLHFMQTDEHIRWLTE